jgi:5-(carboxyamino)imidazole ribonucleotide mutase
VQPVVAIVMGSSSDHEIMKGATILERFGVPYEVHVVSAHRTPEAMIELRPDGARARDSRC